MWNPGDRIGRYEFLAEAAGTADVARFRATTAEGEPVELLCLRPPIAHQHAAQAEFADLHRKLIRQSDPGLNPTLDVFEDRGTVFAVRRPLEDASLAALMGPLPAATVAAIGARLLPAVLAAGASTRSALTAHDIGRNPEGQPVLAPLGLPSSRIQAGAAKHAAPEAFRGAPADGPAGLYGLGTVLYRLATGRDPAGGPTAPPPSALQRGIPPGLDQAIQRLLSSDPSARAGALPLLQQAAAETLDLRQAPSLPAHTPVAYTRTAPPPSRTETAPAQLTQVPVAILATLEPADRSALAGRTGVPESELERLVEEALPLSLGPQHPPQKWAEVTGLSLETVGATGCAPWALALAAAGLAPIALVSAFFFLFPAIGVSVVALGLGTGAIGLAVSRRRRRKTAQRAWASQQQWRRRTAEIPSLAKLYEQAADLRRRLADTELPLHMHADLRQSVREIERAGSALAERVRTADSALERLDPPQLRIRLAAATAMAAHDPKAAMERDQLARALADLDEVVARRSQAITDLERLQGSLSEVALSLTRTAALTAHDEPELDAVHRKVQALQQAIRVRD